ncbi:histone H3.2 [Diplonema papillatum]|nr:histone H3.2 [Diplonema papillatum]
MVRSTHASLASKQDKKAKAATPPSSGETLKGTAKVAKKVPPSAIRARKPDNIRKEIRRLQKTQQLLIPKATFGRLVRQTLAQMMAGQMRVVFNFSRSALAALHEAAEAFMTKLMQDALLCQLHAGRRTLMRKDVTLARRFTAV